MSKIDNFEALLAKGMDNALLRFSLGNEYLQIGDVEQAVTHLRAAVNADSDYSAAWKLLGRALTQMDQPAAAVDAFQRGIEAAERRGDVQAAKEMQVFLRRLQQPKS